MNPVLLAEAARGADSLLDFIPRITAGRFIRPAHLRRLTDLLARANTVGNVRGCTSTPPRHAKTETLAVHGIPWYLTFHPDHLVAYVTHSDGFARDRSAAARDVARECGIALRADTQNKSLWRTPEGGGLLATSRGSREVMGRGFHLVIADDLIGNRQDAESPTIRDQIGHWFEGTLMSRVQVGGSVIVNATRWHADDLIGRLSKRTDPAWDVVNLPALGDDGAPLWPDVWTAEALGQRQREVGPYEWASLYQGQPRPRGGALFLVDDTHPTRYQTADTEGARTVIVCDPATTAKTTADHTAIAVLSAKGTGAQCRMDVLDLVRFQAETPKVIAELRRLQQKWRCPIGVEAVGGFKAVPQMMRAMDPMLDVFDITPMGDKFTRALPVSAAWLDGRVRVPDKATWMRAFLDEVGTFTGVGDAHDDQVDVLAHGWNALYREAPARQQGAVTGGW